MTDAVVTGKRRRTLYAALFVALGFLPPVLPTALGQTGRLRMAARAMSRSF